MGKAVGGRLVLGKNNRGPQKRAVRKRDWTRAMEQRFFDTLAETCNVTLAAAAIKRSITNVYDRRRGNAAFRAAWGEALATGYSRLELILLERAVHGVEKRIVARDGSETVMRDYPERIALALLKMHKDAVAEVETERPQAEIEEARARIVARLDRLRAQRGIAIETKGMALLHRMLRMRGDGKDSAMGGAR